MKYIDSDKLIAEIERRKSLLTQHSELTYDLILETFIKEYDDLLSFLDTLSEEPDKELEEAAEEYRRESFKKSVMPQIDGPISEYGGNIKSAYIAGAEWQKQQMLKDAVETTVTTNLANRPAIYLDQLRGFEYGDKVRIIIVKEN